MQISGGVATLDAIDLAARRVTRELPAAHWLTKSWRQAQFTRTAHQLRDLVFQVDPAGLADEAYGEVQRSIGLGIKAVELHMLESGDTALQHVLGDLRDALEGIECGLHADPSKRPSDEELAQAADSRLLELMLTKAS